MNVPMETPSRILRRIKSDYNDSIDSLPPPIDEEDSHQFSDLQDSSEESSSSSVEKVDNSSSLSVPTILANRPKSLSPYTSTPHPSVASAKTSRDLSALEMRDENIVLKEHIAETGSMTATSQPDGDKEREVEEGFETDDNFSAIPRHNSLNTPQTASKNSLEASPLQSSPSVARGTSARSRSQTPTLHYAASSPPASLLHSRDSPVSTARDLSTESPHSLISRRSDTIRYKDNMDDGELLSSSASTLMRRTTPGNRRIAALANQPFSDGNSSVSSASSHDLTTRPRGGIGNTSLPDGISVLRNAGTTQARFNNVKLNSYIHKINTELTNENSQLEKDVESWRIRAERAEEKLAEMVIAESDYRARVSRQESVVNKLRDELTQERQNKSSSSTLVQDLERELYNIKDDLANADMNLRVERERVEDFRARLEQKVEELDEARFELNRKDTDFKERMHELETKLCGIVEDLEEDLKESRESEKRYSEEVERLNLQLNERSNEDLKNRLHQTESDAKRNGQLKKQIDELEEALDESERQMLAYSEEISSLKKEIARSRDDQESLKQHITRLQRENHYRSILSDSPPVKATEGPPNEELSMETQVRDLRQKLDAAEQEVGRLKEETLNSGRLQGQIDIKDAKMKVLQSTNNDLQQRISSLKQQMESNFFPRGLDSDSSGVPNQSMFLKSIRGIKTPKTPGHYMNNISSVSFGSGEITIVPLLKQIEQMEREREDLKIQLLKANDQVDDKLSKLETAGFTTLSISTQLTIAKEQIVELENKLEGFLGKKGLLEKLKTVACPSCQESIASFIRLPKSNKVESSLDTFRSTLSKAHAELEKQKIQWEIERRNLGNYLQQELETKLQEICELKDSLASQGARIQTLTVQNRATAAEKDTMIIQVQSLRQDLDRVKKDATSLGKDLENSRVGKRKLGNLEYRLGQQVYDIEGRHKDEAKGLLAMIQYLKLKFIREAYFRADLAHQKSYMTIMLESKQAKIDSTVSILAELGLTVPNTTKKLSFRGVATAVLATCRMSLLQRRWKAERAIKKELFSAYEATRGRPYPSS